MVYYSVAKRKKVIELNARDIQTFLICGVISLLINAPIGYLMYTTIIINIKAIIKYIKDNYDFKKNKLNFIACSLADCRINDCSSYKNYYWNMVNKNFHKKTYKFIWANF